MGLLDILNGMQNGPRGPSAPSKGAGQGRHVADHHGDPGPARLQGDEAHDRRAGRNRRPRAAAHANLDQASLPGGGGGGLGDILGSVLGGGSAGSGGGAPAAAWATLLKGGLGGALAGGAAGSMLGGGLNDLLKQLQEGGQKEAADSWVEQGPEQGDRTERSRRRARRRPDQHDDGPERPVEAGTAGWPEPVSAGRDRPADAGRAHAVRRRTAPSALTATIEHAS